LQLCHWYAVNGDHDRFSFVCARDEVTRVISQFAGRHFGHFRTVAHMLQQGYYTVIYWLLTTLY